MGNLHVAGPGDEKEMEERILEKLARAKAIRKEDLAAAVGELEEWQLAVIEAQFLADLPEGEEDSAMTIPAERKRDIREAIVKILETKGLTLQAIKETLDDEKLPSIHVSRAKLTPEEISYLDGMGLLEDDEFF